jgi:hypothetical protein
LPPPSSHRLHTSSQITICSTSPLYTLGASSMWSIPIRMSIGPPGLLKILGHWGECLLSPWDIEANCIPLSCRLHMAWTRPAFSMIRAKIVWTLVPPKDSTLFFVDHEFYAYPARFLA